MLCWVCGNLGPHYWEIDHLGYELGYVKDLQFVHNKLVSAGIGLEKERLSGYVLGLAHVEVASQGPSILTQMTEEQRFLYDLYGRHDALVILEVKQIALLREPARLVTLLNDHRSSQLLAMHPAHVQQLLKAPAASEGRSVEQVVSSWNLQLPVQSVNTALQTWTPIAELILKGMWSSLVLGTPFLTTDRTVRPHKKYVVERACHAHMHPCIQWLRQQPLQEHPVPASED
eukprot:9585183-Karenia_brevis.AAC.1